MGKFAIGQSVPRTEDPRLLTGRGRYIDDVSMIGQCHAFVLRSPHAHARIRAIDIAAATDMPGVVAVFTGADWAADELGHHLPLWALNRRDGSPMYMPPRPALALDRVMLVGDPVAFVIAETAEQARDAAEAIEVDYEPLPVVVATDAARLAGSVGPMPRQRSVLLHGGGPGDGEGGVRAGASRLPAQADRQPGFRRDN